MDKEFIEEFLDFTKSNNVTTKSDFHKVTIISDEVEIATINEDGTLTINMSNQVGITKDFVGIILDYNIKFTPTIDKEYKFLQGVGLSNDKGLCLTITTDNKIVLPTNVGE